MHHIDVATPASISTEATLTYFSILFYGDTPPLSRASLFLALDEWWFVPRDPLVVRKSLARARRSYTKYKIQGSLPGYMLEAYSWSCTHRFGKVVTTDDIAQTID